MKPPDSTTSATPNPAAKHAFFEPVALVLLSLATVGTAWCSYEATVWGGVSQRTMNQSAVAGRSSAAKELQSLQFKLADILVLADASDPAMKRTEEQSIRPRLRTKSLL